MKEEQIEQLIIYSGLAIFVTIVIIGLVAGFFSLITITTTRELGIQESIVAEHCCSGNPCSDTYYDEKTNTCHLTLCENYLQRDTSQCTYNGRRA